MKKEKSFAKKTAASKKLSMTKLMKAHPFETDSQIENRYGTGRDRIGSDGTMNAGEGSNH